MHRKKGLAINSLRNCPSQKNISGIEKNKGSVTGRDKKINLRRQRDLIKLIKYRDILGGCNLREYSLFAYRSVLLALTGDKKVALEETLKLNNSLTNKLSDSEVIHATCSAEDWYDQNRFCWTNQAFCDELNISYEEAKSLNLKSLVPEALSKERKIEYDRKRYEEKLSASGKTKKTTRMHEIHMDIVRNSDLFLGHMTKADLAKKYELSERTIERYIKSIVERKDDYFP